MSRLICVAALLFMMNSSSHGQASPPLDANALVQKIQAELGSGPPPESKEDPAVPHGEYLNGTLDNSAIYPGTQNDFQVYVPAQYDPAKPACLLIKMDGLGGFEGTILDNLIAKKEVPVIIGLGISPGAVFSGPRGAPDHRTIRNNRCYQFDSTNDRFSHYILDEVLPAMQKMKTHDGRAITISTDGNDHMTYGASSGGICAFTLAWQRPDQFRRVYSAIGTFVAMRGGNDYPALIRKTEPKSIRLFLEDGDTDAWNLNLGSWYEQNLLMESALTFAGYDVAHAWGKHGHDGGVGGNVLPDVLRWMWRDYPAPIKAGRSQNDKLGETLVDGEGWDSLPVMCKYSAGVAADSKGDVTLCDKGAAACFKLGADEKTSSSVYGGKGISSVAYGQDGTLYVSGQNAFQINAAPPSGSNRVIVDIPANRLIVTHDGTMYASQAGEHPDSASKIWMIKPNGEKKVVDEGISSVSGIALSPDGTLFFAAEKTTKWVYSYVVQPDGTLTNKQPFFWLHMDDISGESGAEDMAVDTHGNLYVATRMGIQICDQNGRVRAILPLPTPCGPARGICFGGPQFDELYVTDGMHIFKRKMKVPGYPQWSAPIKLPDLSAG
jgi:gluconolactonase